MIMWTHILIVIIALAVPLLQKPAGAQDVSKLDDPLRHGYALLIGNSRYEDRAWPPLNDIPLQLTALKKGLDKHFDRVEIVENLKAEQLRQTINTFLRTYGNDSNARLLIYYAGHGYTEPIEQYSEYRGYITGTDTPKSDYTAAGFAAARLRAISMIEIRAPLPEVLAGHILFIFDSCFAGSIFTNRGDDAPRVLTADIVARLIEKPSRDFITAGRENETVPAHSPIPDLLLAALSGEADKYGLGVVSATEIATYLRNSVLRMQDVNLTPQGGRLPDSRFAQGEFLFRVNPTVGGAPAVFDAMPELPPGSSFEEFFDDFFKNRHNAKPLPVEPKPKPQTNTSSLDGGSTKRAPGPSPTLLSMHNQWGSYIAQPDSGIVCYALAQPYKSEGNIKNRKETYLLVSDRPGDKIFSEISIIIGYTFKRGTDAFAQLGSETFALYTDGEGAWVKSSEAAKRMLDQMRNGGKADEFVVMGTSSTGVVSADRYHLDGFADAVNRAHQECGRTG
jgi:hypothetical protein